MEDTRFLIGIDPGEQKCGVAILECGIGINGEAKLVAGMRPEVQKLGEIIEAFSEKEPITIAFEQYRVYNHKLASHRFSRVQTVEAIGMLEYLIKKFNIPHEKYMAGAWKGVVKDARLKDEGFWGEYNSTDARHIRDATGIAVYAWRFRGIFNQGKRVLTRADLKKLGH